MIWLDDILAILLMGYVRGYLCPHITSPLPTKPDQPSCIPNIRSFVCYILLIYFRGICSACSWFMLLWNLQRRNTSALPGRICMSLLIILVRLWTKLTKLYTCSTYVLKTSFGLILTNEYYSVCVVSANKVNSMDGSMFLFHWKQIF